MKEKEKASSKVFRLEQKKRGNEGDKNKKGKKMQNLCKIAIPPILPFY